VTASIAEGPASRPAIGWRRSATFLVGALARIALVAGLLIGSFVVYELWGTSVPAAKAQRQLGTEWDQVTEKTADAPLPTVPAPPGDTDTTPLVEAKLAKVGDPVATIEIPKLGVKRVVVEGATLDQLRRGPGHFPGSPLPGQAGNASIAGHRTTYGQPFHNIDKLAPGDEIKTTTVLGPATYRVTGVFVVGPRDSQVLDDKGDNRLTLVACHPKYSAAKRLIVTAELVDEPAPRIVGQAAAMREAGKTSRELETLTAAEKPSGPAAAVGLLVAALIALPWAVSHLLWRRRAPLRIRAVPWLIGAGPLGIAVWVLFGHLIVLMPAR
jgi:sortase A